MDSLDSQVVLRFSPAAGTSNLVPRRDHVFTHLLERALQGDVPVYFAIIPRVLIRPFDATCNVSVHPAGQAAVTEVMNDWSARSFHYAWVYPREGVYVLPEDYVIWTAVERSQVDYMPCWILGFPSTGGATEINGPLDVSVVRLIREGSDQAAL
ncbi:MAG: hypothetical protein ACJ796_01995 [Gemmatimonadaceae bacterium]